ncbi:hypothetical protein DFH06DRAFT_1002084 [Mycena polygramma]|nr:hypothetical protein DFH06DRAFT_1002084 [Mycena polygramma]
MRFTISKGRAPAFSSAPGQAGLSTSARRQSPALAFFFHHAGWCWTALTALGDFDADLGGHLILWTLGRILRFPAGTTVLLPPLLQYSIGRIRSGETRYSLTQYCISPPAARGRWPSAIHLFTKLENLPSLRT